MRSINRLAYSEQPHFICLQETWIENEKELEELKHRLNYTGIESNYRTVETMGEMIISLGGEWEIKNVIKGHRYLIFKISNGVDKYNIVNLHAQSVKANKRGQFFEEIAGKLLVDSDKTFLVGDFNVVLEDIDKTGNQGSSGAKELRELIDILDLSDTYRVKYPNALEYTCKTIVKGGREVEARLDRIYAPRDTDTINVKHIHSTRTFSDHSAICATYIASQTQHCNPHWKFNETFLDNGDFREHIEGLIELAREGVSIDNVKDSWDRLVENIRKVAKDYGKEEAKIKRENIQIIKALIDLKGNEIDEGILEEYDRHIDNKLKGARIRARIKDTETDDWGYILSAERKHIAGKNIKTIRTTDGNITSDKQEIAKTFHTFYSELYTDYSWTHDDDITEKYINYTNPISDTVKQNINMDITIADLKTALSEMETDKSPGPNGLTVRFFRTFFNFLAPILFLLIKNIFITETIPSKIQLAYMTLLLKDVKASEEPRNYRPISLLNVEFKLITKALVNKIKPHMSSMVHENQACSIAGRSILDHNHYIRDLISYAHDRGGASFILSLDQAKAFDRVSHPWLYRVLRGNNLPDDFVKWVKILYTGAHSNILVNGVLSESLELGRGVRQGDGLSPMLYVLTLEPLLNFIRSNIQITGMQTPHEELKVLAYADDTNFFPTNKTSFDLIIDSFQEFGEASGSSVNIQKSKAMAIGKNHTKFTPKHPIEWVQEITTFGLSYTNTREQSLDTWDAPIRSLADRIVTLHVSRASIFARARIVNTYFFPKLTYRAHSCNIGPEQHRQLRKHVYNFVLGNSIKRIAFNTLTQNKVEGGVALRHFECAVTALRLKFLAKCVSGKYPSPLARYYLELHLTKLGSRVDNTIPHFTGNLPIFYKELVKLINKYSDLILHKHPHSFYEYLNREVFRDGKFMIYQIKRAPLNDPTYRPLMAFKRVKEAEVAEVVKHQTYILMYGATPTKVNATTRDRYGIHRYVPCALCGKGRETEEHLYMECPKLMTVLGWLSKLFGTTPLKRAIFCHDFPRGDDPVKDVVKSEILLLYRWTVWRARKRAIHEGIRFTRESLLDCLKERVRRHAEQLKPD